MDSHDIENYFSQHRRTLGVLFLIVCMVSVSGLFMGMRQTEASTELLVADEIEGNLISGDIPAAPRYADIENTPWLANRDWSFNFDDLPKAAPDYSPQQALSADELAAALIVRSDLRAFDGAPPVVPHQIDQLSSNSCMLCHSMESTLSIGDKRPATISHPYFANCTQCHIPADGLRQLTEEEKSRLIVASYFQGRNESGTSTRAYTDAPPTIPHPLWMRQNCVSCHGPGREFAIRTSHPERQNCLQCHAIGPGFDNRERVENSPPPLAP